MHWELAPCYDLTYNEGPGGEHQMDILGEGRLPTKRHLLELATRNGLKTRWATQVIERISEVAGSFLELAKNHAIRKQTLKIIAQAIEDNRLRMTH